MKALKTLSALILLAFLAPEGAATEAAQDTYTLSEAISYALRHNTKIVSARADITVEASGIASARADGMPKLDLAAGVTTYRYPAPVTPIYGTPTGVVLPEFDDTLYDAGIVFTLPLYRGGRLSGGVRIAEMKKAVAEGVYSMTKQDVIYNITSAFYKILELEKLVAANDETVTQLEAHRRNVGLFYQAGTVAKVDVLKTETELGHARHAALVARSGLESAYELLKTLMGVDDMGRRITVVEEKEAAGPPNSSIEESEKAALLNRPDYQAAFVRTAMAGERVKLAEGRRLPSLNLASEYTERSGTDLEFKPNWTAGVRLTIPLFEGGSISSDVSRAKADLIKAGEDERALRLQIIREVRDSHLNIESALQRINVSETAVESAKEGLRIEQIRYKTGAGTSTDVIDAQAALLRAETEYYQALYDRKIALASLRRAIGEDGYAQEERR